MPILSILLFLPLAGAVLIALLPGERVRTEGVLGWLPGTLQEQAKWLAFAVSFGTLVISLILFIVFDKSDPDFQFTDTFTWIRGEDVGFDVQYALGVDGLSMPLVLLNGLLATVAVMISWRVDVRPKEYFAYLLIWRPPSSASSWPWT